MEDVTVILSKIETGEASTEDLLVAVYQELRQLAQRKMSMERPGHTLQATALVHEAWLRLGGSEQNRWQNRRHFFGAAAEAMRRSLVDHARKKRTEKRGGGAAKFEFENSPLEVHATPDELLAVHEALDALEAKDPQAAELVKLRYFIGLSVEETAETLGISVATAKRWWAYARSWLHREVSSS